MKSFFISFFVLLSFFLALQTVRASDYNYSDTLLVINDNSTTSQAIGSYFLQSRPTFPAGNVVHLNETPTIDGNQTSPTEYINNIKTPIENFITANNLSNVINYIILTRGIPLRLYDNGARNSVDSELASCLGKSNQTCPADMSNNPFYNTNAPFSHQAYNMYLVTRLNGYTPTSETDPSGYDLSQVKALVDHSSADSILPEATLKSQGLFVLDGVGPNDNYWPDFDSNLKTTNQLLINRGWRTNFDDASGVFLNHQQNVLGYWSWGSNMGSNGPDAIPHNTYENGSIGETVVSTSARSFDYPPVYGQSLIADLIAEGISAVKGYTWEPYVTAIAQPDIMFEHYTAGYNMAESLYAASPYTKWMDLFVGDPKMTISAPLITSFNFVGQGFVGAINSASSTISLTVPFGTDVTNLTPTITVSAGGTVSQASGVTQDFTNPVTYTTTSSDGLKSRQYVVIVTVASNTEATINSFVFSNPATTGIVNDNNSYIYLTVTAGTNLTNLTPSIAVSVGATISPASGVPQDFINPVIYTVTAHDGVTSHQYTAIIVQIDSFKLVEPSGLGPLEQAEPIAVGTINNSSSTVSLIVPFGTNVTSLAPIITVPSGGIISPPSGVVQDFTNPVVYTVTSQDGVITKQYTVSVTQASNTDAFITSFVLPNHTGRLSINNVSFAVSSRVTLGTGLINLTPVIGVSVGATISPASGVPQDFINPVIYTVTAHDGVTKHQYTVTVSESQNVAKAITSFSLNSLSPIVTGTITETDHHILLTVPYGTNVTALTPTVSITGILISPASGEAQDFTSPVLYTVTPGDRLTTQKYLVTVNVSAEVPVVHGGGGGGGGGSSVIPKIATTTATTSLATSTLTLATTTTPILTSAPIFLFTHIVNPYTTSEDVRQLQIFLNTHGYLVASSGSGSPGHEITYFGDSTMQALVRFQNAHYTEILKPAGVTKGTGVFGLGSIKYVNEILKASAPTTTLVPATTFTICQFITLLQTIDVITPEKAVTVKGMFACQ